MFRDDVTFVCFDDKSKVDFGEPTMSISSSVRYKKAIFPIGSLLSCLDHDCESKETLTPSVCLDVDIPSEKNESFYLGQVSVVMMDSVFQPSTPLRHGMELQKMLNQRITESLF